MTHRLPSPGSDDGDWGDILNDFLGVSLNSDGTMLSGAVSSAGAEVTAQKGVASGYAGLNSSGLVPTAQLATGTASNSTYLRGDGTWVAPNGALVSAVGAIKTVGAYSVSVGQLIPCDVSGGNVTLTLPNAPANNSIVAVKLIALAGSYSIQVYAGGSDVYNKSGGSNVVTLSMLNQGFTAQYNSAAGIWYVVGDDLPLSQLDMRYLTVSIAAPTGVTATDTSNIQAAIATLPNGVGAMLEFTAGTYVVSGITIQSLSRFSIRGKGAVLKLAPATSGSPQANTSSVLVLADCTDFLVTGLTIDGNRQQYTNSSVTSGSAGPVDQFLTANANSGQSQVIVQDGTKYFSGQKVSVYGGLSANSGAEVDYDDAKLTISSIAANVLTLSASLSHAYTAAINAGGAYVTTYQTGSATVAGRALTDEDMQNGLHLINCQRFRLVSNEVRNVWESPIRMGTFGIAGTGCSYGTVADNNLTTGYDQGVAVWRSDHITVNANTIYDSGWAGVSCTNSFNCVVTGNTIDNVAYRVPGDSNSGSGIACEGGAGHSFASNVITRSWAKAINLSSSPLNALSTTLTAPLVPGASGSIAVSSSSSVNVGQTYAIYDGSRSEHVTITSVPDSTHISIGSAVIKAWHPSGSGVGNSMPMDISITGNNIQDVSIGSGIQVDMCARIAIVGNTLRGSYAQAINLHSPGANLGSPTAGGAGILIEGNQFSGNATNGGAENILVDSLTEVSVVGNRFSGYPGSGTIDIHFKGVRDSIIANNHIADSGNSGIFIETGNSVTCKRLTVADNSIVRTKNEGIIALSGDALTITGNTIYSCNATGIDVRAVTHSIIKANSVVSNNNTGIKLEDNSTACTYNRVEGNIVRDDVSGSWQGTIFSQSNGIVETGTGDHNAIENNLVSTASTKVGASTTISGELVN